MFAFHQAVADQLAAQRGCILVKGRKQFVDLLLGVTLPGFESARNVAQDSFQLFALSGDGLQAPVRQAVIADNLAVEGIRVQSGCPSGQQLWLVDGARLVLERFCVQPVEVVVTLRSRADQPGLAQAAEVVRNASFSGRGVLARLQIRAPDLAGGGHRHLRDDLDRAERVLLTQ